jgi:hypothetical protein
MYKEREDNNQEDIKAKTLCKKDSASSETEVKYTLNLGGDPVRISVTLA